MALIILSISFGFFLFKDRSIISKREKLLHSLKRAKKENLELKEKNRLLLERINRIREDPKFIEHVAKDELGMIKDNELILVISE